MKIDGKFLRGDKLVRWFTFWTDPTGIEPPFEVALRYPDPAEWKAAFGDKPDAANDDAVREFAARHVADWRGLDDDEGPVKCDEAAALQFMRRDARFSSWLTLRLTDAASFRRPARDGAARPAGDADAPSAPC